MSFWHEHASALAARLAEHMALSGTALVIAFALGLLLAVLTHRRRVLWGPLLAVAGMLQTVPGIALLVIMMALFGRIGALPALWALVLYALLPIVQNALVGLNGLPPALGEAARGLGLSRWQRLWLVQLPLAVPTILAGLRIAAVQTVGLATLAAFVGAGGLGQFINRGLFLSDTRLILLGAIPAALLALYLYFLLGLLERAATPVCSLKQRRWALGLAGAMLTLALGGILWLPGTHAPAADTVTVGSKNFTEQLIVAEMVAQQIETHTKLHVVRRFGLGGSSVMQQALRDGAIDMGVEYSGTALRAILHRPVPTDRRAVLPLVQQAYTQQFGLRWLAPLGFDNSYELAVRTDDARLAGVRSISALVQQAPQLTAAFDFEFAERDDGYAGLQRAYGLHFGKVVDMHPDLLYAALRAGNADVISAYATDGRMAQPGLRALADDRHFFPPYAASVVVSATCLQAHPELGPVLDALSGKLDNARMRALNAAVDSRQMRVEQAAAQALKLMGN